MARYIDADKLIHSVISNDKYGTITKSVFVTLLQNADTEDVAPVTDGYKDGYRNGCKDTLRKAIECLERNAEAYNGELGIYDAINCLRVTEESYNET